VIYHHYKIGPVPIPFLGEDSKFGKDKQTQKKGYIIRSSQQHHNKLQTLVFLPASTNKGFITFDDVNQHPSLTMTITLYFGQNSKYYQQLLIT